MSKIWSIYEAKNRFSELINAAQQGGVQFITRHGKEVGAVLSMKYYWMMNETFLLALEERRKELMQLKALGESAHIADRLAAKLSTPKNGTDLIQERNDFTS